jgi:Na+/melibiose symporter-like transporter
MFVLNELHTAHPLIPLTIFRNRNRNRNLSTGNVVMLLVGAATVALFFALSLYMQTVLGYDALTAGLSQLPMAGALVVVATIVPNIVGTLGTKRTPVGALVLLSAD